MGIRSIKRLRLSTWKAAHYTVFLLHCTFFFSCSSLRTEVDPTPLLGESVKLVVNGYLAPQDTVLAVKVGRSKPVLEATNNPVPYNVNNATVRLSNGTRTVNLPYNAGESMYMVKATEMPIVAGRTYSLTVSTPDGKRVTATARIPQPVPIRSIRLDSTVGRSPTHWYKQYYMTFDWQDVAGEENYYQYAGTYAWIPPVNSSVKPFQTLRALAFQRENTTNNLLTDAQQDGRLMSSLQSGEVATVSVGIDIPDAEAQVSAKAVTASFPGARVTAHLFNVEKVYYRYEMAVTSQRQNRDNPFAEPVLIPSNIEGGLGCFAGYNRTDKVLGLR